MEAFDAVMALDHASSVEDLCSEEGVARCGGRGTTKGRFCEARTPGSSS